MATFGNTTIEPNPSTYVSDLILAFLFNGGPTSGTLQSISIYLSASSATNVETGVYGATSNNLIASSSAQSVSTAGWYTSSVTGTLNDTNGNYYICFWPAVGNEVALYYGAGGSGLYYESGQTYPSWPSTASFSTFSATELGSAYFTYTTSSGNPVNFIAAQTRMVMR